MQLQYNLAYCCCCCCGNDVIIKEEINIRKKMPGTHIFKLCLRNAFYSKTKKQK